MGSEILPLIEAEDISFGYDRELVLESVDLSVRPRDFLAVIGPNGGGKTTLIKILLGLLQPRSGRVLRRLSGRRGGLGYVPQFSTFDRDFPLAVLQAVRMGRLGHRGPGRHYTGTDREATDAMLDRFGLTPLARTAVRDLSGGQLQRVLLARALVSRPEILFLDEPLASIDAEFRETLMETLAELNREIPVVVVTHDMTPFAGIARQIACVNRRLHYHPDGELTRDMLEEVYGCPVELVAHGVPHRVLGAHEP